MNHLKAVAVLLVGAVFGCTAPVTMLRQPKNVPVFVETFSSAGLKARTRQVPCVLNLLNVPREATLTELGMSGTRQVGPAYPARDIVLGEFNEVLSANFRPVAQAEQARIELKVESRKLILERDGDDLECSVALSVQLLNPLHLDKPYFSKVYEAHTIGTMMDEVSVPECIYEAVQCIAERFVREVGSDSSLAARLAELK